MPHEVTQLEGVEVTLIRLRIGLSSVHPDAGRPRAGRHLPESGRSPPEGWLGLVRKFETFTRQDAPSSSAFR